MLEVVISYENVFSSLRQREGQYACLPTSEQWKFAIMEIATWDEISW